MPEILGLAGPCRSLLRRGLAPAPGRREDTPSSAGLQWHYSLMVLHALSVGSVRLLKENKTSMEGCPGEAEFEATRSPTLQTSVPGEHRWGRPSVGDV
jgi:hypothetical protein